MSERKKLKKYLQRLKYERGLMPRLIDCSGVYGDGYYKKECLDKINKEILEVEQKLKELAL
jgi:hypothetical protein